jgi:hypothetical protein
MKTLKQLKGTNPNKRQQSVLLQKGKSYHTNISIHYEGINVRMWLHTHCYLHVKPVFVKKCKVFK